MTDDEFAKERKKLIDLLAEMERIVGNITDGHGLLMDLDVNATGKALIQDINIMHDARGMTPFISLKEYKMCG